MNLKLIDKDESVFILPALNCIEERRKCDHIFNLNLIFGDINVARGHIVVI